VDLEQIFQIFPQTKFAKEDYSKRRMKMREALADKEEELLTIRRKITVLESTLKNIKEGAEEGFKQEKSTDTVMNDFLEEIPDQSGAAQKLKEDLEQKEIELEDQRMRSVKELNAFEKQQSQIILGKIYKALKELALEEQVTLVVDKSSILFGSAEIDLTDKLQQKVRGF